MKIGKSNDPSLLLLGDIFFWTLALWVSLLVRYWQLPSSQLFLAHFLPFLFIFFCWAVTFFISNLYSVLAGFFRKQLVATIVKAQIINSIFAVAFFYFFPSFDISPKTVLLIDLVFSLLFIFIWRFFLVPKLLHPERERVMFLGNGEEVEEIKNELKKNPFFFDLMEPENELSPKDVKSIEQFVDSRDIGLIIANFRDNDVEKAASRLYNALFTKVSFVSLERIYEEMFGRIPLSLISDGWILENISYRMKMGYMILKRTMDIIIALVLGIVSLVVYPFVFIALKLEDGGALFSIQTRVGQDNEPIKLFKFRTMSFANDGGVWAGSNQNRVTRVGAFLRKSRIDELPQLWNVVLGDVSLVGPRPEFAPAVAEYEKEIPYYSIRHLIKPGLSGWAQINHEDHPHHGVALKETEDKLSYDIYYLKNRSLVLDLKIALKTVKTLLSREGI